MALGLVPMVYDFCPGIHTIISKEIGFITPVGDTQAVAENILFLDSNRPEIDRMGQTASKLIKENFQLNDKNTAYFHLFRESFAHRRKKEIQRPALLNRLDHPRIPLIIAKLARFIRKKL
jgi:glycosyltransferase involved in cell wall biosynthesis